MNRSSTITFSNNKAKPKSKDVKGQAKNKAYLVSLKDVETGKDRQVLFEKDSKNKTLS